MKKGRIDTRNLSREQKLALVVEKLDRDAEIWKLAVVNSESLLDEFVGRLDHNMILRPGQR